MRHRRALCEITIVGPQLPITGTGKWGHGHTLVEGSV